MKKLWTGRVKLTLLLAVVLAAATAIISAQFGVTWAERAVQTVLSPIRGGVKAITRQVERYYNYIFEYESLEAENAYLEERIAQMEEDVRNADSLQRENERLRELLELSEERSDYRFCAAYVIAWDSSNWKSSFTIGKGSSAGLEVGMVVVTENAQVLGQITALGSNWATVTTILDSSQRISATVASSGYTGVVQGSYLTEDEGKLRMNYLPNNAVLRNNDQVVTAGSTIYPKGLILGYIIDAGFDETGVSKYALLQPAASFDSLEQVFVITHFTAE